MINVAIIDDESLALYNLTRYISDYDELNVVGAFTNPDEFLDCLDNNKVQLVFLDIEMPQINGLDLASKVIQNYPDVEIVFATAYNEYAVNAFELNALDYILKPVSQNRLSKTIEKVTKKIPVANKDNVRIRCFGGFDIIIDEKIIPIKSAKAKEILAYLVHNEGKSLGWMPIADEVWPDAIDDKKLMNNFHVACYALRSFLSENGIESIFEYSRNLYKIDVTKFSCDLYELFDTYKHYKKTKEIIRHPSDFETGEYLENLNYMWSYGMADKVNKMIKELKKASN